MGTYGSDPVYDAVHVLDSWRTSATGIVSLFRASQGFSMFYIVLLYVALNRICRFADDHGAHFLVFANKS